MISKKRCRNLFLVTFFTFFLCHCFILQANADDSLQARLNYCGYGNVTEISDYLEKLKKNAKISPASLLKEVRYPFSLYEGGKVMVSFKSARAARNYKGKLITKNVLKALEKSRLEDLFVNFQGIMLGDGEIWIGRTEQGEYYIKAINP